jgi:hypothetical protein
MYVLLVYGILAVWILVSMMCRRPISRFLQISAFFAVLLVFVLRFNMGPDTSIYIMMFNRVTSPIADALKYESQRNVGFNLLLFAAKSLFHSYPLFVLTTNLVIAALLSCTVLKYSKNILISLLIFIGSGTLEVYYASGVRQALSMFVFLYAFYRFIPKKQYWWYELFCLIAFSFHEIALIAIPVPLLAIYADRIREHQKVSFLWAAGISLGVLGLSVWFSKIVTAYDYVYKLPHFVRYLANPTFSFLGIAQEIVLAGLVLFLYRAADQSKLNTFDYTQLLVCLLSFFVYVACCSLALTSRVSDYLQVIYIVFLPNLISLISSQKKAVLSFCAVAALNAFLLYADLSYKTGVLSEYESSPMTVRNYPYITVFEPVKIAEYFSME